MDRFTTTIGCSAGTRQQLTPPATQTKKATHQPVVKVTIGHKSSINAIRFGKHSNKCNRR